MKPKPTVVAYNLILKDKFDGNTNRIKQKFAELNLTDKVKFNKFKNTVYNRRLHQWLGLRIF